MTHIRSLARAGTACTRWGLLALGLACSAVSANAEYRLSPGEVIEISVAGLPELRQRVTVQLDGSISLPLLGTLVVGGSSASDARAKIQSALATKVFRQKTPDGRERPLVIEFDEVAAAVVEYKPIYVSGDVSKPGELIYRPQMTVRQAVASSGGYDLVRNRTSSTLREAVELQADYVSLWATFAKEQVQMWGIRSELGGESDFDRRLLANAPVAQAALEELLSLEIEHAKARKTDYERERTFLQRAIAQADEQIAVFADQQKKEEQGTQADIQDLQRVTELFGKGALALPRVTEARRAVLLSSTRQLQTTAHLLQVTRQRTENLRQLEKLDDQRKITLLRDLQEAGVRLSGIQAKLQAIREKLEIPMGPQSAIESGRKPQITVIRKGENGRTPIIANGDFELEPGDFVEVVLRPENEQAAVQ